MGNLAPPGHDATARRRSRSRPPPLPPSSLARGILLHRAFGHFFFLTFEFMTMVGTFGGWGMRIEFVPDDELHKRPRLKVREPKSKGSSFTTRRS
jgi:hypothetical protein